MRPNTQAAPVSRNANRLRRATLVTVAVLVALGIATACKPAPTATRPPATVPSATPTTARPSPQPTVQATPGPTPAAQPSPIEAGFFLSIQEPPVESVVRSPDVAVKGTTSADAVVSVNGKVVSVDASGAFAATVTLQVGPNVIEVVASDFAGHQQSAILTAIYLPQ